MDTAVYYGNIIVAGFGWVHAAANEKGLVAVGLQTSPEEFCDRLAERFPQISGAPHSTVEQALRELREYLEGQRKVFTVPVDWSLMPEFQQRALRAAAAIPYGSVHTYGDLASLLGSPRASRAVGGAMARNPIPIILPCHRVVGSDRKLHGFSLPGGLHTKEWLLRLEGNTLVDQRLV